MALMMKRFMETIQFRSERVRKNILILALSMMFIILGFNLYLIESFSSSVPFWDEWDAIYANLFIPYMDNNLHWNNFIAAHNEHRLMFSRLAALLIFNFFGYWDPVLQMICNVLIRIAIALYVLIVLTRTLDSVQRILVAMSMTLIMGFPYATENLLMGMNTQFYTLILFGIIAIHIIVNHSLLSIAGLAGIGLSILSYFSLAFGALIPVACAMALAKKILLKKEMNLKIGMAILSLLLLFGIEFFFTPKIEGHEPLRAHSVNDFYEAYSWLSSWPIHFIQFASLIFINLPWIILTWRIWRRKLNASNLTFTIFALGVWIHLQFAALAIGRAQGIEASRYLDVTALNLVVNIICIGLLRPKLSLVIIYMTLVFTGLIEKQAYSWQEMRHRHATSLQQQINVQEFLSKGDFLQNATGTNLSLPYPDPARLKMLLESKHIFKFLPNEIQSVDGKTLVDDNRFKSAVSFFRDLILRSGLYIGIFGLFLFSVFIFDCFRRSGKSLSNL